MEIGNFSKKEIYKLASIMTYEGFRAFLEAPVEGQTILE